MGEAAPNFEETVAFYRDAWGLTQVDGDKDIAFFAAEGSPENYILRVRRDSEKRFDLLALAAESAADVDAMAQDLAQANVCSSPSRARCRRPEAATASASSTRTAAPSRSRATPSAPSGSSRRRNRSRSS